MTSRLLTKPPITALNIRPATEANGATVESSALGLGWLVRGLPWTQRGTSGHLPRGLRQLAAVLSIAAAAWTAGGARLSAADLTKDAWRGRTWDHSAPRASVLADTALDWRPPTKRNGSANRDPGMAPTATDAASVAVESKGVERVQFERPSAYTSASPAINRARRAVVPRLIGNQRVATVQHVEPLRSASADGINANSDPTERYGAAIAGQEDELPSEQQLLESLGEPRSTTSILTTRPAQRDPAEGGVPADNAGAAQPGVPTDELPDLPDLPEFVPPSDDDDIQLEEPFGQQPPITAPQIPDTPLDQQPSVEPRPGFLEPEPSPDVDAADLIPETDDQRRARMLEYNGADCDMDNALCAASRRAIVETTIDRISLDIAPLLVTVADDLPSLMAERDRQLAKIPSRVWKDTRGEVLAEGVLEDYTNGFLVIRDASGGRKRIAAREIGDDDRCFVSGWWRIPNDCRLPDQPYTPRAWTPSTFTWTASALCHKPLYFEDVQLERYGHTQGPILQPLLSGAHFFGNTFLLPYNMGLHPPNECQYVLGHYRPGDCAPWLIPAFPIHPRAVRWQTAAVLGGIGILP